MSLLQEHRPANPANMSRPAVVALLLLSLAVSASSRT